MIKRFRNFVYESKYDSLANFIAKDLLAAVKATAGTNVGRAIHREFVYSEPLEFCLNFIVKRVLKFDPNRSTHFKNLPWEILNFEKNGFSLDANAYIPKGSEPEDPELELILYISPTAEPLRYTELEHALTAYIRHEIEHLLQTGINQRDGHRIKTHRKTRDSAESTYRYFLLADEIPAMVAGMNAAALKKKIPIDQEFELYLRPFLQTGMISEPEFNKVMANWLKFARAVYANSDSVKRIGKS